MSIWSRITYAFSGDRLNREIDEEFAAHIEEAIAAGDDPAEVRRTFGSQLRLREQSRDARIVAWLDYLRADFVFAWRQLLKRKITTAAAIFSLALAIGACTSAFRLIDALLLRPLPINDPATLYAVQLDGFTFQGKPILWDTVSYPSFHRMREALR
ncbi:MAG: multidrug ABC transporter substrate-binding protein, partial [Terracidiphilus sp.]